MNKDLVDRLSRVQGQIEALKKSLTEHDLDGKACLANSRLLKASINGLKKFGAAYMSKNIHQCLESGSSVDDIQALLQLAVDTGFDL